MSWEIPASGKTAKPPVGNHLAVCVALIDMGHQEQEDPMTKEAYWSRRAFFVWELVSEVIAGTNKNHVIAADLTLSTKDTAKLAKWVKARTGVVIGAGFNPLSELGQACLLNVVANKSGYPNVDGMAALPAAFAKAVPPPTYPPTSISLEEFKAGKAIPEWVPWCYGSPIDTYIRVSRELGGVLGVSRAGLRKARSEKPAAATEPPNNTTFAGDPIPY